MSDGTYIGINVMLERRNTALLISLYGYSMQLNRPSPRQLTDAGGAARTIGTYSFPPRRRWISTQGRESYEQEPGVGSATKLKHYIVGTYDDDILAGDWFINPVDGRKFVVQFVAEDHTVECRAEIEPVV